MVIHGHEDIVPTDVAGALGAAAVTSDAVANLVKAPEFPDVDVQQLAGHVALVPLHGFIGPQIAHAGQSGAAQHATHGGLGHAHVGGNARLQHQLSAQLHDGKGHVGAMARGDLSGREDLSNKPDAPSAR